jgi:hypothetical protein
MQPQHWADPLAKQYATYLTSLREKLALVSKRGVGSAAKASRSYFAAEIERVEEILNADRSAIDVTRTERDAADTALQAHCAQPVPADEEGEIAYYVRRNRLVRASEQARAALEFAVRVHGLPPVSWNPGNSMAALEDTEMVQETIKTSRASNSSTDASDVIRRTVSGVRRDVAMLYGYWEERDLNRSYDDETRRMFEYRWYWVANELGLETGPQPDGLIALPEYRP